MTLGEKIRIIRDAKGIKQQAMAEALRMTQQNYSKLEAGKSKISSQTLKEISKQFGVQPEDIENFTTANFFSNNKQAIGVNHNYFPSELKSLYEDKIRLLEDKVRFLESYKKG